MGKDRQAARCLIKTLNGSIREVKTLTTVQPDSENFKRATKWILEERKFGPQRPVSKLIQEACMKFDLSPLEAEFLGRFVKDENI